MTGLTADVIVIGSGAGGAAVAGALAAGNRKVLLFEAGPRHPAWPGAHARNVDPSEAGLAAFGEFLDTHLVYPSSSSDAVPGLGGYKVAHVFGGMFALWTCNCPSPDPKELPPWDDPQSWHFYLEEARGLLHVSTAIGHDGVRMQRLLAATKRAVGPLPENRDVQRMPVAAREEKGRLRFSAAEDLLRRDALPTDRLEILTDAIAPEDDPIFTIWVPYSVDHPWHNQLCLFPGLPAPLSIPAKDRTTADIFTWIPMDIDPENRLTFHLDQLDPFGLPVVNARFEHSRDTRQRAGLGLAEHFRIASEVGDLRDGWFPAFYKAGESTHLMGSCRMGPADDGTSVVDRSGRLWRYGNAVLCQSNAGNPTLTTVAAALRTAAAILQ